MVKFWKILKNFLLMTKWGDTNVTWLVYHLLIHHTYTHHLQSDSHSRIPLLAILLLLSQTFMLICHSNTYSDSFFCSYFHADLHTYTVCLIMMLTLIWSFNFGALYTKSEKSDRPSLNIRNVEWFFLYKTSIQQSLYIMAVQNTTTPKIRESGTTHWLCGVGWNVIPVICYVEAVINSPGEYFFCIASFTLANEKLQMCVTR